VVGAELLYFFLVAPHLSSQGLSGPRSRPKDLIPDRTAQILFLAIYIRF
jgi:hypothetical protein